MYIKEGCMLLVKKDLPLSKQAAYSFGEMGKAMLSGIMGTYLLYFYIPTQKSGIAVLIPQDSFLGVITVMGTITMIGKVFDAFSDPWIASLSDRCRSEHGRRIPFMRWSAFPYAFFTVLVFCCPVDNESGINAVYLTVMLLLYYLFSTMYSTPYNALLSELGHTSEQRINLSTAISVTWFVGYFAASQAPSLWQYIEKLGVNKTMAIRISFGVIAIAGLICLMIPVIAINERLYCETKPSSKRTLESVRAALSNREFRIFVFSNLFYRMGSGIFQSSMLYYVTVLLGKSEDFLTIILIGGGIGSFLFYYPVNALSKKYGKKKLIISAFCTFVVLFIYGCFLGMVPISAEIQGLLMILMVSPAMAIFGILPNAVLADIAQYDGVISGERREGIFTGTRTLISKLGHVVSTFIVSRLLLIKINGSNERGVRLTLIAAAIFSLMGLMLFLNYDESKIQQVLDKGM